MSPQRFAFLLVPLAVLAGCTAAGEGGTDDAAFRAALLTAGPVSDAGWYAGAYEGLLLLQDSLGAQVSHQQTRTPAEFDEAFFSYASTGYDLVFAHGFEYQDAAMRAAERFPGTTFVVSGGGRFADNVVPLIFELEQGSYLAGMIAAGMSRSGVLGMVGGVAIPPVEGTFLAFEAGARAVDPDVEVLESFTGSWDDVSAAKEAAVAQLGRGADVIIHNVDAASFGVFQAVREAVAGGDTAWALGMNRDQNEVAPDVILGSAVIRIPESFLETAVAWQEGALGRPTDLRGSVRGRDRFRAEPRHGRRRAPRFGHRGLRGASANPGRRAGRPQGPVRGGGAGRAVNAPLASLRGLVRRFRSVTALAGADLEIRAGEVHGVLGENGAGKTTLLGVLGGMLQPDAGQILIAGKPVELSGPRDAWQHGVGLVHQHFTLVPTLTVLENLSLGREADASGLRLPLVQVREAAQGLMARTGLAVPLDARVEELGVGDRQRVEILKALLREPPILVLDEPTAVLTPSEVHSLFGLLRELAAQGRAVVLVAHKVDEVLAVSDRVTVLRRGRTVMTSARHEVDAARLIRAIVGDVTDAAAGVLDSGGGPRLDARASAGGRTGGEIGLEVARLQGVHVHGPSGHRALTDVSFTVSRGEIVGIAGVEGNGQRELALVLTGRIPPASGVADVPVAVGFVPQDRTVEGIVPDFDLVDNVALALQDDPDFSRRGLLAWGAIQDRAEEVLSRFGVVASGVDARAGTLSGGNQQRLVVGRELSRAGDLLVAENPTRGLDVAATAFVHGEIERLASARMGPGVVLISTDLDEILSLSSRVLVMARGRLLEVPEGGRTREGIGALMLGGSAARA